MNFYILMLLLKKNTIIKTRNKNGVTCLKINLGDKGIIIFRVILSTVYRAVIHYVSSRNILIK